MAVLKHYTIKCDNCHTTPFGTPRSTIRLARQVATKQGWNKVYVPQGHLYHKTYGRRRIDLCAECLDRYNQESEKK